MPILTKPSSAPRTALTYITIGALLTIWPAVLLVKSPPHTQLGSIITLGVLLSGIVLMAIGFMVGQIGRSARNAELPPREVTNHVALDDRIAAVRNPGAPVATTPAQSPPPTNGSPATLPPTGASVAQTVSPYSQV